MGKWETIITTGTLKWEQISVPTKDLMLFETLEVSAKAICERYGFPYDLWLEPETTVKISRNE